MPGARTGGGPARCGVWLAGTGSGAVCERALAGAATSAMIARADQIEYRRMWWNTLYLLGQKTMNSASVTEGGKARAKRRQNHRLYRIGARDPAVIVSNET